MAYPHEFMDLATARLVPHWAEMVCPESDRLLGLHPNVEEELRRLYDTGLREWDLIDTWITQADPQYVEPKQRKTTSQLLHEVRRSHLRANPGEVIPAPRGRRFGPHPGGALWPPRSRPPVLNRRL